MYNIVRTEYVNVNGTPKVRAKGWGKQRTVAWDLSKSTDWNHGTAAGVLVLAAEPFTPDRLTMYATGAVAIGHDSNDSGTKHGFQF
jgi:hypothetical protein